MFTAELGKGAYVNGDPISVSDKQEIQEALISFDLGQVDENAGLGLDLVRSLWPRIQGLRYWGRPHWAWRTRRLAELICTFITTCPLGISPLVFFWFTKPVVLSWTDKEDPLT